eukprot:347446-Chlamydomonas_euryale.AAC.1
MQNWGLTRGIMHPHLRPRLKHYDAGAPNRSSPAQTAAPRSARHNTQPRVHSKAHASQIFKDIRSPPQDSLGQAIFGRS